jgi:hypothetical protein
VTAELVRDDSDADPDELVAAAADLAPPPVRHCDAVLVVGPWLAGVSSLAAALRDRMPERVFVESVDLPPDAAPAAVVFAVSAVAPLAESDCAVLDAAVRRTDLVIGVLTKTDVHPNWRAVLDTDAETVRNRSPRYRQMPWVGVAATPDHGPPQLDALVELLRERLADASMARRNRLRTWEFHLSELIVDAAVEGTDVEAAALHRQRDEIVQAARLARSEHTIALRSQIQQARVQLSYFARNRCTSVRTELSEDAAGWGGLPLTGRRDAAGFERYVRDRAAQVVQEVDAGAIEHLRDVAAELGLARPEVPPPAPVPQFGGPALASRRLETQLMMLLGAGFGLGVALAASRLFTGLAPGLTAAGMAAGGLVGLVLMVWVVGIRGLLQDRALLDRWVTEVTAMLRDATEQLVASRVLLAEVAFTGESAARDEQAAATCARHTAAIDARLRERAVRAARAAATRQHRLSAWRAALAAVRAGLAGS